MKNLEKLKKYFGAGTAEGENAILEKVFVTFEDYEKVLKGQPYLPRIIIGKKGSGKSAILKFIQLQMKKGGVPTIYLKPEDISISENLENIPLGTLTRKFKVSILKSVAIKLGELHGKFVENDKEKFLVEIAKSDGLREEDIIEKSSRYLAVIGKKLAEIDFAGIGALTKEINPRVLEDAIRGSLDKNDYIFYILIDDTDQISSPSDKHHLDKIWAFLLASRSITEHLGNVKIIITLRTEVWRRLGYENAGRRDQVDHFRNLIFYLKHNDAKIKKILYQRIKYSVKELGFTDKKIDNYSYFFDKDHVKIPYVDEYRYWHDFLTKSSRNRPRDAIQLVSELSENAIENKHDKIGSDDVSSILPKYSEERVNDLRREVDEECPKIKEIIRVFSEADYDEGSFTMSTNGLIEFLRTLPSRFSIILMGEIVNHTDESIFRLWKFLYEVGFINARVSDRRERKGYRHISSDDDPELVSKSRWNDIQRMTWEVHPAYRSYLIKLKQERSFAFGISKKKKKKRKVN